MACVVNVVGVYWPSQPGPDAFPIAHADKVVHVVLFAAVAWTARRVGVPGWPLAGVLVLHAVSSELVQGSWLAQRSGDPLDVAADLAGIALGLLIAARWLRRTPVPVVNAEPEGATR